jgi:8-oxo-dGTP diphosphatase
VVTGHTYRYPRPALTVDVALFGWAGAALQVLLVQRDKAPFDGSWALPGGFVQVDEGLEAAALRELDEKTHIRDVFLEQLYTFGAPDRDPRDRVVSVAYFALVRPAAHPPRADAYTRAAGWFEVDALPELAFDHAEILRVARARLRSKVRWAPIGFELLPPAFTLGQLQRLYEAILGRPLDKRNFRKKLLSLGLLTDLNRHETGVAHRPSRLYAFDRDRYDAMTADGLVFEL